MDIYYSGFPLTCCISLLIAVSTSVFLCCEFPLSPLPQPLPIGPFCLVTDPLLLRDRASFPYIASFQLSCMLCYFSPALSLTLCFLPLSLFHSPLPSIKASQLSGRLVTLRCTTWSPVSHCRSTLDVSAASPPRCCWTSPTSPASTRMLLPSSALDATRRSTAMQPQPGTSQPAVRRRWTVRATTVTTRKIMGEGLPQLPPPLTCGCRIAWMR